MAVFTFFYGAQAYEFERPEIIAKPGAKVDIGVSGMTFTVKQNDTAPALEAQLLDSEGNPINLDMCGVRFHMQSSRGQKLISRPAIITDEAQGRIKIEWLKGDTDTVDVYKCEFQVTFTNNTILTIPNDGYFLVSIYPEIN